MGGGGKDVVFFGGERGGPVFDKNVDPWIEFLFNQINIIQEHRLLGSSLFLGFDLDKSFIFFQISSRVLKLDNR